MSIDDNTAAVDALFNEYNNLWNEKLLHKQSIRKFQNYITYLFSDGVDRPFVQGRQRCHDISLRFLERNRTHLERWGYL